MPSGDVVTDPNIIAQFRAGSLSGGGDSFFPGIDATKRGEEYLSQFPAEIQQGVRDYVHGFTMPTGNPRRENVVKIVAGKYGADINLPANDANFKVRADL